MLGTSPGRHDGVCANVEFPFPGRLVGSALAAATGVDPESDPWSPERAVWPLLDRRRRPPRRRVAGAAGRPPRRCGTRRRRVAARPALRRGPPPRRPVRPLLPPPARDDHRLGRRRRHRRPRHGAAATISCGRPRCGGCSGRASARPARRSACRRRARGCATSPSLVDLPARLSLFGLTRLAASHAEVLDALGAARDVHLFLLHPSPVLWESVAEHVQPG